MTPDLKHFYLARLSLEAATPLSVATGNTEDVFDVVLVRDANGLPALPGSSIAGVLRHLYWETHGQASMEEIFGGQERGEEGNPSCLHVSWGAIQDSGGKPVEGLLLGESRERLKTDPLLKAALAIGEDPIYRDRVRIGHRGAAVKTAKFDRAVLPAGYRFSAELSLWSGKENDEHWQRLLNLLRHPLFRLGGGTRAGLGRITTVSVHTAHFDLSCEEDRKRFSKVGRGLGEISGLEKMEEQSGYKAENRFLTATLTLKPRGFWRIGQGDTPQRFDGKDKPADLLPKMEQRVIWDANDKGRGGAAELLIPASSIKGALAHRIAFHANRLAEHPRWAEEMENLADYDKSEHCQEVRELFGYARNDKTAKEGENTGQAGRLFLDDAFLSFTKDDLELMMHNAIDRFTGGVREHMLFSEELVWKKEIAIELALDTKGITENTREALRLALNDLIEGRLAIGGGSGKGHGFCNGSIQWSDSDDWINVSMSKETERTVGQ